MKKSSYFKMNMPEYSDPIDIEDLTDDIETIDTALMTTRCSKTRTTNSINEKAILPYCRVANENEFDITVIDRNFNVEYVIEAGKGKKFEINGANYDMNFMVKDLHEAKFEWFIPVADAIAEGGGGSGGTSNYNDLTNKPQINSVTLSGNKTLTDLGITNSSGKIKSDLLPAFVDNYDSYANRAAFPATGVEDRLYLAKDTRLSYVWDSGTSDYVVVGSPLALGESSSTAYRGDRGKTAYDHSQATHANVNATVVAASATNGNIKIDGVEKTVYTHPKATGSSDTNPHGTTASDVGLGNVGNFKAVSTSSQSLSDTEKSTARANIGAGTSSFDGKYSSLSGIPSTFTPATHSHAGSEIALNATSYSKDAEQKTISKDTKVDKAVAQLEYRTDVLAENKVDKTTVSSSISSSKCTIEVPEKSKAVSVCTMKGKTQKVVQMLTVSDGSMTLAGVTISRSNGVCTFNGTSTSTTVSTMSTITNKIVPNHVYLFTQKYDTVKGAYAQILVNESTLWTLVSNKSMIYTAPSSVTSATFRLHVEASQTYSGNKIIPQLFDLTAMGIKIGSTDAETISNFEQAIKDLYVAPTDGVLWNAANESVVSLSKNLLSSFNRNGVYIAKKSGVGSASEGWTSSDYIEIEPNTTYTLSGVGYGGSTIAASCIYNSSNSLIQVLDNATGSFTTPASAKYIRVTSVNRQINNPQLEKGSTATAYVAPYKHTAEIPISLTSLADYGCSVPKSDGSGTLYNWIDFENGLYYHNVVSVNLGNLTYGYATWGNGKAFHCSLTSFGKAQNTAGSTVANAICGKYNVVSADVTYRHDTDKVFSIHATDTSLYIVDSSYTDESEFKKSLSGSYLVYELADASKTVTDISDIIRPLKVEAGGTVTFVNPHNIDCDTVVKYKKEV